MQCSITLGDILMSFNIMFALKALFGVAVTGCLAFWVQLQTYRPSSLGRSKVAVRLPPFFKEFVLYELYKTFLFIRGFS